MKPPDAKSAVLYAVAILVVCVAAFVASFAIHALVIEFGADVFWGAIVLVSVLAGFGSAIVFLKDAGTWAVAQWPAVALDVLGFVACAIYFGAVAGGVTWWRWLAP